MTNDYSLIDTHAHCYSDSMLDKKSEWIERLKLNQISKVLLPNIDIASINQMHDLCDEYPNIFYQMMGLHPCDVKENYKQDLAIIYKYLSTNPDRYCGVGEIGLDYHWDLTYQSEQIEALKTQFEWAIEFDKAVSIHSRKANQDTIPLITEYSKKGLRGVMHCFSGSKQEAQKIIDCGFYLGIGGVLTFPKAGLQEVIKEIDLKHIVLETDSPYLAPVPYRGKPNEPSYLINIASCFANLKGISLEEVAEKTTENAKLIFNLI
jgi:TatD DNase family protein